ncbi:putative protein 37 [Haloarcula hispanica icosahedral virus 2]|uniref:Uncharacterized protein n=1 Tax=Haloarcula hispanica icosahedral virus 2 TaxID=1154689 RepID=H9AZZ3_9VIRU|nr:putative protein 37 [Haloarcula hispanica icosahedral virus 2]AFD02318.1 putative protein 37 [Haloarcula hispanica icosahedral virus 2]
MNPHHMSERVDLLGVGEVERPGSGKVVADAWIHLEGRPDPTPARRLLYVETADGAVYRFQSYGPDEYLTFYDRRNEAGDRHTKAGRLPAHVEAVRAAVVNREVLPDYQQLLRAEAEVGEGEQVDGATDEEVAEAVADVALSDGGRPTERRRRDEANVRSGVSTRRLERWSDADEATTVGDDVTDHRDRRPEEGEQ